MAQELEGMSGQAQAWAVLGPVYTQLGKIEQAVLAYEQALACAGERGRANIRALPRAGLVELALSQGDLVTAQGHVEVLLSMLVEHSHISLDEPFRVFLACYRALGAVGDPRTELLLARAWKQLEQYADAITDSAQRASFLQLPTNRALLNARSANDLLTLTNSTI